MTLRTINILAFVVTFAIAPAVIAGPAQLCKDFTADLSRAGTDCPAVANAMDRFIEEHADALPALQDELSRNALCALDMEQASKPIQEACADNPDLIAAVKRFDAATEAAKKRRLAEASTEELARMLLARVAGDAMRYRWEEHIDPKEPAKTITGVFPPAADGVCSEDGDHDVWQTLEVGGDLRGVVLCYQASANGKDFALTAKLPEGGVLCVLGKEGGYIAEATAVEAATDCQPGKVRRPSLWQSLLDVEKNPVMEVAATAHGRTRVGQMGGGEDPSFDGELPNGEASYYRHWPGPRRMGVCYVAGWATSEDWSDAGQTIELSIEILPDGKMRLKDVAPDLGAEYQDCMTFLYDASSVEQPPVSPVKVSHRIRMALYDPANP